MSELNPTANEAILLTAPGAAAIAVIRIRGPGVGEFLNKCFSKPVRPGQCVHGELRDGDSVLDDPLIVQGANSRWADISVHGGDWVIRSVLELTKAHGFAVIEAALPLPDAALDDDGSVLDREVEAYLPLARTELAIRTLLAQPESWRRALAGKLNVTEILQDRSLWWLLNPPQIAIVGEPNVGKSTLANQLFGEKRSITADMPGTTRDWVGDFANIGGLAVHLIDTPGLRETGDEIERAAIAVSEEKVAQSDLKICVLDATQRPQSVPTDGIVVINKIDQPAGWDISAVDAVQVSAITGDGVDLLRGRICEWFGIGKRPEDSPRWWTERQKILLGQK